MKNLSLLKIGAGLLALGLVAAGGIIFANRAGNGEIGGGEAAELGKGVSTAVACEEIAATRGLVNTELAERKAQAATTLGKALETASDNYWDTRRALDAERTSCETEAQLADPCKDLFEESSRLAQEILAGIDQGFDETKFQKREEVKAEYDNCLENPPRDRTTAGMLERCQQTFNAGNDAALTERATAEEAAQNAHDSFVQEAEAEHRAKMGELDALEKECEDTKYERKYGSLPGTGIPVTDYVGGSSACTGIFPGNDSDLQRQISNLRSQHNKAKAAGKTTGFMGTIQLQESINELEAEMAAGLAKCTTDADCGGPVPVCCNIKEIGRAFCSDGICANEKTACAVEEVCAGKPAQCMALIPFLVYKDYLIPVSELHQGTGDEPNCDSAHWHGNGMTLSGMSISDPNPDGCGYGKVSDVPVIQVYPPSQGGTGSSASGDGGHMLTVPAGGGVIRVEGGIFGN